MKENKWLKEILLILAMAMPFLVYALLRADLPETIPSHYSISKEGKWVADSYMPPLGLVSVLFAGAVVAYLCMSIPLMSSLLNEKSRKDMVQIAPFLYGFKVVIVVFLSGIPVYEMLVASGKIPAGKGVLWGYISGIVVLVLLNIFLYRLFASLYRNSEEKPLSRKPYVIIWAGTHLVLSAGPVCSMLAGEGFNMARLMPQLVFVFLAVCGNLMYNVRPNYFFGIRTPWTLKNETVWRRTHRVGGVVLFIAGTLGFMFSWLVSGQQLHYLMLFVILVSSLVTCGYSYYIYRKIIQQTPDL
ncbi:SdpI family protein [Chitinophaga sp. OAE865]|uniref:SdpI family protein n=1 Tax=Chitinophaga sp. OAE865 TaxID=2817898 RepID=UPI001AE8AA4C